MKSKPTGCEINRGISSFTVVGKMYARALMDQVFESTEMGVNEDQREFRKDKTCSDIFLYTIIR